MTILLVDDEPDIRTAAGLALSGVGGHEVTLAESGVAALAALEKQRFDGRDPGQQLRSGGLGDLRLVIYTARDLGAADPERLTLGMTRCLTKSATPPDALATTVRALLAEGEDA